LKIAAKKVKTEQKVLFFLLWMNGGHKFTAETKKKARRILALDSFRWLSIKMNIWSECFPSGFDPIRPSL
jgi:hypothetical protein